MFVRDFTVPWFTLYFMGFVKNSKKKKKLKKKKSYVLSH